MNNLPCELFIRSIAIIIKQNQILNSLKKLNFRGGAEMGLKQIMNSPGMWLASSVMLAVIVIEGIIFLKMSLNEANRLKIPKETIKDGIRSSIYTSLGPTLAMTLMCVSMVALYGGPTTWMRMNDVGAARTELAVGEMAKALLKASASTPGHDIKAFVYALWGMALNNFGWFFCALIFTKRMGTMVVKLNEKFDGAWIKMLMTAALLGLFGYMLSSNVIGKTNYHVIAAVIAGVTMLVLDKLFGKYTKLQEFALGIALFAGIFGAQFIKSLG